MYALLRSFLFRLTPEAAHKFSLIMLGIVGRLGLLRSCRVHLPTEVMGLTFSNPIGLAAGFDKNGDYLDALGRCGFGFIEVGTVTPKAQPGNPRPRIFRLPAAQALINRMGFNNKGVDYLVDRLRDARYKGIVGVSIGKGFDTPIDLAGHDYVFCLTRVYPYASYVAINLSSPNTPALRDLQGQEHLGYLLEQLKTERMRMVEKTNRYVPLVLKVSPDLDESTLCAMAQICLEHGIDGIIATNTTTERLGVQGMPHAEETGGLSGKPLAAAATKAVRILSKAVDGKIPIIGAGGIMSARDALEKREAGAQLLQIYSGFIYHGPSLLKAIAQKWADVL